MNIQTTLQSIHDLGNTDAAIAIKIDATQATVSRLRRGLHKSCSYERAEKIKVLAKKLKVKI